jgi:hypothetical protein
MTIKEAGMTKNEAGMTKNEAGMTIKEAGMTKNEAGVTNEKRGKGPGMTFLRGGDEGNVFDGGEAEPLFLKHEERGDSADRDGRCREVHHRTNPGQAGRPEVYRY